MILSVGRVFRISGMSDCLKLVGKVPVVKERLKIVVMIGNMVDETCLIEMLG